MKNFIKQSAISKRKSNGIAAYVFNSHGACTLIYKLNGCDKSSVEIQFTGEELSHAYLSLMSNKLDKDIQGAQFTLDKFDFYFFAWGRLSTRGNLLGLEPAISKHANKAVPLIKSAINGDKKSIKRLRLILASYLLSHQDNYDCNGTLIVKDILLGQPISSYMKLISMSEYIKNPLSNSHYFEFINYLSNSKVTNHLGHNSILTYEYPNNLN